MHRITFAPTSRPRNTELEALTVFHCKKAKKMETKLPLRHKEGQEQKMEKRCYENSPATQPYHIHKVILERFAMGCAQKVIIATTHKYKTAYS